MKVPRVRGPVIAAVIAVVMSRGAPGQTGGAYDLRWSTPAAGGTSMAAPGYTLTGTIGPSATATMQGSGGHELRGGFWAGVHAADETVFRDGFESAP